LDIRLLVFQYHPTDADRAVNVEKADGQGFGSEDLSNLPGCLGAPGVI